MAARDSGMHDGCIYGNNEKVRQITHGPLTQGTAVKTNEGSSAPFKQGLLQKEMTSTTT